MHAYQQARLPRDFGKSRPLQLAGLRLVHVFLIAMSVALCSDAQTPEASTPGQTAAPGRRLYVEPSSSAVSLGKVSLTVSPLIHQGHLFTGDYGLQVVPYVFKNEKGKLELEATDETVDKIIAGTAMEFTGKATNEKNGKTKAIIGKITPSAADRGSVTFSVQTDNGLMVFNSTYHFAK